MKYEISTLVYSCAAVAIYVGLYYSSLYFKPPRDKTHRSFAFLCFSMAAYSISAAGLYRSTQFDDGAFWQKCEMVSIALIVVFTMAFIFDLLGIRNNRFIKLHGAILGVLTVLNVFTSLGVNDAVPALKQVPWFGIAYYECELGVSVTLMYVQIFGLMIYIYRLLWKKMKEGKTYLRPIIYSLGIYFATSANDMFVGVGLYPFIYLVEYGFFVVLFSMARSLQLKFSQLYEKSELVVKHQSTMIETIQQIQTGILTVVDELNGLSHRFVDQAMQYTTSADDVGGSVEHVTMLMHNTTNAATDTLKLAEISSETASTSIDQLRVVEQGFLEAVPTFDKLHVEIQGLAGQITNTEEILGFIKEIAQQINILAINAGIQAAKVGQYGTGFRVVAGELRSLIKTTHSYLFRSQGLLADIKKRANQSSEKTHASILLLTNQIEELRHVSTNVSRITDVFTNTSKQVDVIVDTAHKQLESINNISTAIEKVKSAAGELPVSAQTLVANIDKLIQAHEAIDREIMRRTDKSPP